MKDKLYGKKGACSLVNYNSQEAKEKNRAREKKIDTREWYEGWKKTTNARNNWRNFCAKLQKRNFMNLLSHLKREQKTKVEFKNQRRSQSTDTNSSLKIIKLVRCPQPLEYERDCNYVTNSALNSRGKGLEEKYLKPADKYLEQYYATASRLGETRIDQVFNYYRQKA